MATFYLRPSADNSLSHSCSTGSTGYNLINEATADDDSTYIYKTYSSSSSGGGSTTTTSSFTISGTIPINYNIDSAKVVIRLKRTDDADGDSTVTVNVGSSSSGAQSITKDSYANSEASIDISNLTRSGTNLTATLTIITYLETDEKDEDGTIRITQTYVQVEATEVSTYTITTSSLGTGTITADSPIRQGESGVVKITPGTDISVTSVTDNGTNVTDQLVYISPTPSYTFTNQVSGADYGFNYDGTKYWVSTNAGESESASVAQLTFTCEVAATLVLAVINYAEATYDYGIVGAVDQTLDTSYTKDSGTTWDGSDSSKNVSTEQDITISLPAGSHFVQIKYRKDQATSSNNDNFQVRIKSLTYNTAVTGYYQYTISSISANHTVIATFSDYTTTKFYYKVNGSWKAVPAYQKVNGAWVSLTTALSGYSKIIEKYNPWTFDKCLTSSVDLSDASNILVSSYIPITTGTAVTVQCTVYGSSNILWDDYSAVGTYHDYWTSSNGTLITEIDGYKVYNRTLEASKVSANYVRVQSYIGALTYCKVWQNDVLLFDGSAWPIN